MQKPQQYEATLHSHNYSPNHQVDFVRIKITDPEFVFEEGQFIMIWVEIDGVLVKRSYSIATSYLQWKEDQTIGFIIKLVPDGMFTTWLWNTAQIGEKMMIIGALGHMKLPEGTSDKNFVLISTGSGLSPIHGIFGKLLETQQYQNIYHLHGEKSEQWFVEEEITVLTHSGDNISNTLCLSREEESKFPNQYNGYVTKKLEESFGEWLQSIQGEILCYLCGKPEIVNEIMDQLIAFGIEKNNIKCEKY